MIQKLHIHNKVKLLITSMSFAVLCFSYSANASNIGQYDNAGAIFQCEKSDAETIESCLKTIQDEIKEIEDDKDLNIKEQYSVESGLIKLDELSKLLNEDLSKNKSSILCYLGYFYSFCAARTSSYKASHPQQLVFGEINGAIRRIEDVLNKH